MNKLLYFTINYRMAVIISAAFHLLLYDKGIAVALSLAYLLLLLPAKFTNWAVSLFSIILYFIIVYLISSTGEINTLSEGHQSMIVSSGWPLYIFSNLFVMIFYKLEKRVESPLDECLKKRFFYFSGFFILSLLIIAQFDI